MKTDFSRGKCPVCGMPVKFRQNKNGILYTYCDRGHHAKLGRADSNEATAAINAGQAWNNGILYMYPLETKGQTNGTGTKNTTGTINQCDGTDTGRRTSGKLDTVIGSTGSSNTGIVRTDSDDDDFGFF